MEKYAGIELVDKIYNKFSYENECYFYFMLHYSEIPNRYNYHIVDEEEESDEILDMPNQEYDLIDLINILNENHLSFDILNQVTKVEDNIVKISSIVLNFKEYGVVCSLSASYVGTVNFAYSGIKYPTLEDINPIAKKLYDIIESSRKDKIRSKMSIFLLDRNAFSIKIPFKFEEKVSIEEDYNDDFSPINDTVKAWLDDNKKNGLIILNGEKGSGKSSYIKSLIKDYYGKMDFVFVTSDGIDSLIRKGMTVLVEEFNGKVVILEDCENMLKSRDSTEYNNSIVPILLNLTDGILSNVCRCKFILTFNTKLTKVDSALLRKGRCYAQYEFGKLCHDKSVKLLNKLGYKVEDKDVDKNGMTLSDIFYYDGMDNSKANENKRKIGFN